MRYATSLRDSLYAQIAIKLRLLDNLSKTEQISKFEGVSIKSDEISLVTPLRTPP